MFRVIGELRPRFAVVENVPNLVRLGLDRVLADLASIRYDAEWTIISARDVGAPHLRKRLWVIAYPQGERDRYESTRIGDSRDELHSEGRQGMGNESNNLCKTIPDTGRFSNQEMENARCAYRGKGSEEQRKLRTNIEKPPYENNTQRPSEALPNSTSQRLQGRKYKTRQIAGCGYWIVEPELGRVADGIPHRVDRLKSLGNAIVPQIAEYIGRLLIK